MNKEQIMESIEDNILFIQTTLKHIKEELKKLK